jgi:hypothetical protein
MGQARHAISGTTGWQCQSKPVNLHPESVHKRLTITLSQPGLASLWTTELAGFPPFRRRDKLTGSANASFFDPTVAYHAILCGAALIQIVALQF